jgi:hypothetical protein
MLKREEDGGEKQHMFIVKYFTRNQTCNIHKNNSSEKSTSFG